PDGPGVMTAVAGVHHNLVDLQAQHTGERPRFTLGGYAVVGKWSGRGRSWLASAVCRRPELCGSGARSRRLRRTKPSARNLLIVRGGPALPPASDGRVQPGNVGRGRGGGQWCSLAER